MDYRAMAELVMMSLVGLSLFTLALGFSVKVFLAPVLRDLASQLGRSGTTPPAASLGRLDQLEDRLDGIERGLDRLAESQRFDRELGAPGER